MITAVLIVPFFCHATETATTEQNSIIQDTITFMKARVTEAVTENSKDYLTLPVNGTHQMLKAEVLEGGEIGKVVTVENDYVTLKAGDIFYLSHTQNDSDATDYYAVSDPYRLPGLYVLIGIFILAILIFGGIQGIRGLASLVGSFLLILYVLMPAILHGYSPILVSIGVSSLIIIVGSYITHGFNKTTSSAVAGMIATVIITGILAYIAVHATKLTGFSSEESVYLNYNTQGSINFIGLLFGGIMIGLLGVLYDISIGQAISVEELHRAAPHLPRKMIYKRAIRIGREHIGALVNTLAIAYVGASLPLLLLFYTTNNLGPHAPIINQEIFATEIVRIMIGSIGLILAVPITTLFSSYMLIKKKRDGELDSAVIEKEQEQLAHFEHHH